MESLNHVELPDTLDEIGDGVFMGCLALRDIELPSHLSKIGVGAFQQSSLSAVTLPNSLKEIGDSAFAQSKVKTVIIPEGTQQIDDYAFAYNTNLTILSIPSSTTHIGIGVVNGCSSLSQISIDTKNPNYVDVDNSIFTKDKLELICCNPAATGIYTVPSGTVRISEAAFGNSLLDGVIISEGVTSIGDNIFSHCRELKAVYIPKSVAVCGNFNSTYSKNWVYFLYEGLQWKWETLNNGAAPLIDLGELVCWSTPSNVQTIVAQYYPSDTSQA